MKHADVRTVANAQIRHIWDVADIAGGPVFTKPKSSA